MREAGRLYSVYRRPPPTMAARGFNFGTRNPLRLLMLPDATLARDDDTTLPFTEPRPTPRPLVPALPLIEI